MSELTAEARQQGQAAQQTRQRGRAMHCPHCHSPLRIRYSQMQSAVCRQGGMECTNTDCGWRGAFSLTLDATHVESAVARPTVNLPLSEHARRRMEAALEADRARHVSAGPGK